MKYLTFLLLLSTHNLFALELSSTDKQTIVVELYTSEGCSSCPPADKWLSKLKHDPRVFKQVIPMAFHVDYWDDLGWKDPWAQAQFSNRQRQLALTSATPSLFVGLLSQVYTPAFLVAGHEWPKWRNYQSLPNINAKSTGILKASLSSDKIIVNYSESGDYQLNIAYLGMGIESDVKAGENVNRHLKHDFVVLNHIKQTGSQTWSLKLPAIPEKGQQQTAISIWLTKPDSLYIEQAVASLLP